MLASVREFIGAAKARLSRFGNPLRLLVFVAIVVVAVLILLWVFNQIFFYYLARSYVDEVAKVLGVNHYLANAITWATFVVIAIFARYAFSFSNTKRRIGILGVVALLAGQSLVLWYGTRNDKFDRQGNAIKCYIITRDSLEYGELLGIDPKTGRECRPVTPDIAERLEKYQHGNRPKRIVSQNPVFFDPRTGNPIVWYYRDDAGKIEIFDLMGFDPTSGKELTPVTKEVVDLWNAQKELAARKAPDRIYPDPGYQFFDLVTGEPRVWYLRAASGEFEFYDRSGFSPATGERFSLVNTDVIAEWMKYVKNNPPRQCYIITKETVLYREHPGIDSVTGRECRLFTPQLLERLRLYEKGNRPKIIQVKDPTFFDLRTGEPIVWYFTTKSGAVQLFDLMGFSPETGEELLPVSKETVDLWKAQNHETPQVVDLTKYAPFDPVSGNPRVWYWRSDKGDYEFYNNPGFQPRTGEPLLLFTKDAVAQVMKDTETRQKQLEAERLQREKESRERTERAKAEKRKQAAQEESDKQKRDEQRVRETQAGSRCDELAGNPTDPKKSGNGVSSDVLKVQARDAIASCEIAVQQSPNELRFQYQLARAIRFFDQNKAFEIQKKLVGLHYPAAYDNLGWLLYHFRKDIPGAVNYFRLGAQLGDPDSMVSLAEMIDRGFATPQSQGETKIELLERAAALGSSDAAQRLQNEREEATRAEQDLTRQQEQQRLMLQMFGTFMQNIRRQ